MSKIASIHLRRLAVAGIAAVALAGSLSVARAAVNPDAFSSLEGAPKAQLNIGKSIFYDERINTSTSGLVQVLLIDGSTFTVGPGSDLVIDKFVYDPKKNRGEMVATFSKGVMRFVGGKLSKNEGGVTVNTPQGALAIRGGMFIRKTQCAGKTIVAKGQRWPHYYGIQPTGRYPDQPFIRELYYNGAPGDIAKAGLREAPVPVITPVPTPPPPVVQPTPPPPPPPRRRHRHRRRSMSGRTSDSAPRLSCPLSEWERPPK
jgi:hypothetical protein